ncbi:unnamed protein product, partial [marine sediment metagenome]
MKSYLKTRIKRFIRTKVFANPDIRKLYYLYLYLTTLTEWYAKAEVKKIIRHWKGEANISVLDAGMG